MHDQARKVGVFGRIKREVDPIYGFAFNAAEKPFSDYSGLETVKQQINNPHPSAGGYKQIGVRLAGFIQSIR